MPAEQFRQSVDRGSKLKYSSKITGNTRINDKLTISENFSFFCKLGKLEINLLNSNLTQYGFKFLSLLSVNFRIIEKERISGILSENADKFLILDTYGAV